MFRIFLILLALAAAAPAQASQACRDDATLKPLPGQFVGAAERIFGLSNMDPGWVRQSTVMRCMGGNIWACNAGANLPCGKANTAASLPAGDGWCRQNPDADFIPAYITGHDSIWQWRCVKGSPATTGPPAATDGQGYLTAYWKILR